MPRSNRPRRRGIRDEDDAVDLERVALGARRLERKRDGEWNVQPQPASTAVKTYSCPGCGLDIGPGTAHLVAWRADGLFGEEADLAGRRHWHTRCWTIRR